MRNFPRPRSYTSNWKPSACERFLEHAIVAAGREPQACHGRGEQALGSAAAVTPNCLAFDERAAPQGCAASAQGPELTHTSEKLDPSLERLEGTAFETLGLLLLTMLIW